MSDTFTEALNDTLVVPHLAAAMGARLLTQGELAARSGVTRNTIAKALRGEAIATRSIRKLLDALALVDVHPLARELGLADGEAPAPVGGGSG